jgi:2'-5' RNA ligase
MMIALLLDNDTAQRLAIPGGEPAEDLHITLCFMGDIDGPPSLNGSYTPYTMPGPIRRVLTAVASAARPLSGTLAGIGRFTTQVDDDTPTPITASVDVPGLTEFRTELVDALLQANYFVADNHGYTPHITLAYIDSDAEMPIESIEPLALHFNTVWLCVGDDRTPFKLGGIEPPPVGESNEEQETYSQGSTPDAVHTRQDQEESHRALHQIQATLTGYREEHAEGSEDTDSKAVLANWITQLFQGIKGRDAASYTLTETEQSALAQKLAEANFAARGLAYNQAMAAAGLSTPVTEAGILNKFKDVLKWARDQVASIIKTMAEQFRNFLDHLAPDADVTSEANAWLDRYVAWKAEQIANATIGAGANEGSMEAIREMLEKAVEGIRVRVVPGESSSDVCQAYAGKDYGVEEYLALDIRFPVHPSCIHSIEVYKEGGAA